MVLVGEAVVDGTPVTPTAPPRRPGGKPELDRVGPSAEDPRRVPDGLLPHMAARGTEDGDMGALVMAATSNPMPVRVNPSRRSARSTARRAAGPGGARASPASAGAANSSRYSISAAHKSRSVKQIDRKLTPTSTISGLRNWWRSTGRARTPVPASGSGWPEDAPQAVALSWSDRPVAHRQSRSVTHRRALARVKRPGRRRSDSSGRSPQMSPSGTEYRARPGTSTAKPSAETLGAKGGLCRRIAMDQVHVGRDPRDRPAAGRG